MFNFCLLKRELEYIINLDEDSVIIYQFRLEWYTQREILGLNKGGERFIL